jgi:16S rRNA C1402 N4-methylase RsmH
VPSDEEITRNPRARSAKLRAAERVEERRGLRSEV